MNTKMLRRHSQGTSQILSQRNARTALFLCLCATAPVALATVAFYLGFNLATASSLELLLVVLVALRGGFRHTTVTSFVALLCLNYLFTEPIFQFTVADPKQWISLAAFEATALIASGLSSKVRAHAAETEKERKRSTTLYELSRAILLIDGRSSTIDQLASLIREFLGVSEVEIWLVHGGQEMLPSELASEDALTAHQCYLNDADMDEPGLRFTVRIVKIGTASIGAMALRGWDGDPLMADALASLVATAVERIRALQQEHRAEAERDVERLRATVLDGLAHGFKTPLTAIQTASSGLIALDGLSATQSELISIIDDQAAMLAQMTTRLLQTATLESRQIRLHRTEISLASLISNLIEQQEQDAQSRIEVDVHEPIEKTSLDQQLLELALLQLIDNAIKYSFVDHKVKITLSQNEQETTISVSNKGMPIQHNEQQRIFERYYRGAKAVYGPPGTGLGLSIVKKAAEAHGGSVRLESDADITTFLLTLPRLTKGIHG